MSKFIHLLLHNGIMNAIALFFFKVSSFLVVIIVANIESEESVGVYGFIYLTLMTFQAVAASGITTSITKRLAEALESHSLESHSLESYILSSGFILSFVFSLLIFFTIYFFNDTISMLVSGQDISYQLKIASFYFLFSGFSAFSLGCVYARLNYKKIIPVNFAYGSTLVLSTYLLTKSYSLSGAIAALVLSEFVRATYLIILTWSDCRKIIFFSVRSFSSDFFNYLWGFIKFSYPIGFSGIIVMMANWYAMKLVVQDFGFVENANVVAINNIQAIALYIPLSIGTALLPLLSREVHYSNNININSGVIVLLAGAIVISALLYLSRGYIDYYYGFEINSVAFLMMLFLTMILSVSNVVENALVSFGESKIFVSSNFLMSVVFISILLVCSPTVVIFFFAKLVSYTLRLIYMYLKLLSIFKKRLC